MAAMISSARALMGSSGGYSIRKGQDLRGRAVMETVIVRPPAGPGASLFIPGSAPPPSRGTGRHSGRNLPTPKTDYRAYENQILPPRRHALRDRDVLHLAVGADRAVQLAGDHAHPQ